MTASEASRLTRTRNRSNDSRLPKTVVPFAGRVGFGATQYDMVNELDIHGAMKPVLRAMLLSLAISGQFGYRSIFPAATLLRMELKFASICCSTSPMLIFHFVARNS